jgi:uncharacterized protein YndB with AHSA1/START domain
LLGTRGEKSPYGERLDASTVRIERWLPSPIERVWEALTDPEKRATWLAGGKTELAIDRSIELEFHNSSLSDDPCPEKYRDMPEKRFFSGQITRCDPPHLVAHTWVDGDDYSTVEYVLTEQDDKVLLVITHSRLNEDDVLGICGGWHVHLDILDDVLEERTPRPFWKNHTAIEADYEAKFGSTIRPWNYSFKF